MPLLCGCFGEEQVMPVKEEKEDVTDFKVIAKIAQFPDVRQIKHNKKKNQEEDSIIGKEMDESAKVPTSIDTTPSSKYIVGFVKLDIFK